MFDTHCHLDFEALGSDLKLTLNRARTAGVTGMVVPGCHPEQWKCLARFSDVPDVRVAAGLHPWWTLEETDVTSLVSTLQAAMVSLKAVAVGECGLDRGRGASLEKQQALFEGQLVLARELNLPVIVHQVGAAEQLFESLKRTGVPPAGGVIHGFSGDASLGKALISRGFTLGVGCAVTRAHRKKLRQALPELPLEHLVLETDAPDQAPFGKGAPGAPEDLALVLTEAARCMGRSREEVQTVTEFNARRLFRMENLA